MKTTKARIQVKALLVLCLFSFTTLATDLTQQDIQQMLIDEALEQDVEPALILAIAKVESDFNPTALSYAGARGVMQIMPATAQNGFAVASHDLYQPQTNIRVGVAYIKQLLAQYQGNVDIALSHYNGGSAVQRSNGELRIIPVTREYVSKVKYYARHYHQTLYSKLSVPQTKLAYAHTDVKKTGRLSYAEQMALDEKRDNQLTIPSKQHRADTQASERNVENSEGRIDELQQLRVHNLTRILGPKNQKANDYTDKLVASQQSWNMGVNSLSSMRDLAQSEMQQQPPEMGSKQQKVASWEAIFN